MNIVNAIGALPTRNHRQTQFEHAEDISGEALTEKYLVKNASCWACPIGCTRISKTDKVEGEGPEFETTWALGAECGIDDLAAIIEANHLCNDLGLDTISAGSTIACAMELSELGLLDSDLRFGRADLLAPTLEDMGYRRGIGAELADGSLRLATKYGRPDLSMSVKGLEMPAYDPRGMQGQGLLYATSNRGALPHARQHARPGGARPAQADRPLPGAGQVVLRHPAPEHVRGHRFAGDLQVHQHGRRRRVLRPRAQRR